jgi:hypothetical protein
MKCKMQGAKCKIKTHTTSTHTHTHTLFAEKGGFEPPVQFPVRQFSKLLV